MFGKNLTVPQILLEALALEGRLPWEHPLLPELKKLIRILKSGNNGEKTINYFLSLIPSHKYYIFHNLRLPAGNSYFQMDFLLLSSKLILILEGKNHSGKLLIEKNQMIHETGTNKEIYENPVSQANRHKILLTYLLRKYKIDSIPIEYCVVICKDSTEVSIAPGYKEAEERVCKANDLLKKIEDQEKIFKKDSVTPQTIKKIKDILLTNHTPPNIHIFEKTGIKKSEVLPGVQCPRCSFLPMDYKRRNWICPNCYFVSQDAYLKALQDYFLLINPYINNLEIRKFLRIPTSRSTTYFLSVINLPYTGTKRGRMYFENKIP